MHQTNVVLAPKDLMEALRVPFTDLRERRLLAFAPGAVSHIEARGGEGFVLQRQPDASWRVSEPQDLPADTTLLRELFSDLLSLEAVEFEKDVVTDFATYGLVAPLRQFLLKTTLTNASGATNVLVAQINFGTNGAGKLFAHRPDENSVYAVRETDYLRLPAAGWQLRERQLWNFSVTNVIRVTITQGGRTHQLVRTGADDWTFGPGSQGLIREVSLERTMARLGTLQAAAWVARGVEHRARYGFTNDGHQMAIELKTGDKTQTLTLEFGGQSKSLNPYAAVTLEGQAWIFEFPWVVYQDVLRDLTIPKLPGERPGA
jgi:hypothetical protein